MNLAVNDTNPLFAFFTISSIWVIPLSPNAGLSSIMTCFKFFMALIPAEKDGITSKFSPTLERFNVSMQNCG